MVKKNKQKLNRIGRRVDIARLDFHDFCGRLIDRTRCNITEKEKGMFMIDKIGDRFNINDFDLQQFREEMIRREIKDFEEMEEQAKKREPVKWNRDEKGNIISPFKSREWKDL